MKKIITIILISLFISPLTWADNNNETLKNIKNQIHEKGLNQTLIRIELENREATARTEFREFIAKHDKSILAWQHWSNIISFILVLVLVLTGLYFSYLQFKKDLQTNKSSITTIEFGDGGIKFSSSVIGLTLLFMSLAFFYLYLDKIYEIEAIDFEKPASQATMDNKPDTENKPAG